MVQIEQDKIDRENFGIASKKKLSAKKRGKKKKQPGMLGGQHEFKIGGSNSKSSMTSGVTGITGGFGFGQKHDEVETNLAVNLSQLQQKKKIRAQKMKLVSTFPGVLDSSSRMNLHDDNRQIVNE